MRGWIHIDRRKGSAVTGGPQENKLVFLRGSVAAGGSYPGLLDVAVAEDTTAGLPPKYRAEQV